MVLALCAATGITDPEEAILSCAQELADTANLRRPYHRLDVLASFQEIIRIDRLPIPDAGRLIPTREGLVIEVNCRHSLGRQNFSVCHEISHTFFPTYRIDPVARHDPDTGEYTPDEAEEEYLCDLAASELLMPAREFERELRFQRLRIWSIPPIAKEFGASLEATAIRCLRADPSLRAVLVWEPRNSRRHEDAGLTAVSPASVPPDEANGLCLKYASYGTDRQGVKFAPRSSPLPGSLVVQAYSREGARFGEDTLPGVDGPVRVYAESLGVSYIVDGARQRKVLTIVVGAVCSCFARPRGGVRAGAFLFLVSSGVCPFSSHVVMFVAAAYVSIVRATHDRFRCGPNFSS